MGLLDSIARVEADGQMANGTSAPIPGRVLCADGDGLAYSCAGSDDTDPAQSRINLLDKLAAAQRACRAERTEIFLTQRGSHKGYRYAIARAKPYQGQRTSSRRPKNWEYLRGVLENGSAHLPPVIRTATAEADDLFGYASRKYGPDQTVIYTEDKDMRMISGWHLSWREHKLVWVPPGAWSVEHDGKVYGRKWFWLQMLHGDAADHIPGLPFYFDAKDKQKLCGPATAEKLLAGARDNTEARDWVRALYRNTYGGDLEGDIAMLEQACLLWMRTDEHSDYRDVAQEGNPMHGMLSIICPPWVEITQRVAFAASLTPAEDEGPPW